MPILGEPTVMTGCLKLGMGTFVFWLKTKMEEIVWEYFKTLVFKIFRSKTCQNDRFFRSKTKNVIFLGFHSKTKNDILVVFRCKTINNNFERKIQTDAHSFNIIAFSEI